MNSVTFGYAGQFAKATPIARSAALYQSNGYQAPQAPGYSRKPADEFTSQRSSHTNTDTFQARQIQFKGEAEEDDPASRIFGDQPLITKPSATFSHEQVKLRAAALQRNLLSLHLRNSQQRQQNPYELAYQKEIQERIDHELKPATTEKKRHSWFFRKE